MESHFNDPRLNFLNDLPLETIQGFEEWLEEQYECAYQYLAEQKLKVAQRPSPIALRMDIKKILDEKGVGENGDCSELFKDAEEVFEARCQIAIDDAKTLAQFKINEIHNYILNKVGEYIDLILEMHKKGK